MTEDGEVARDMLEDAHVTGLRGCDWGSVRMMSDRFDILARAICETGRYLDQRGHFAGTDGNISVRLRADGEPDGRNDRVLITPSGVRKGRLEPGHICLLGLGRAPVPRRAVGERRPSSESLVHTAIYRARKDVGAIIHAHSPYAVAWACCGLPVPRGLHPEAAVHLRTVPVVPYAMPGSQQLADAVGTAAASTPHPACLLMANHGAVAVGRTLDEAADRLDMLEAYLQVVITLRQIGVQTPLTPAEVDDLEKLGRGG